MGTVTLPAGYDAWKLRLNEPGAPEYNYDQYKGLPYSWCPKIRRYRDAETGEIVSSLKAEIANDAECERQDERSREDEDSYWRGEY